MCMLVVKPAGVELFPKEHVVNAEFRNKDGVGVAVADGKTVTIKKDFKSASEAHDWLVQNSTSENAVLFHLRFSTHGLVDEGNRHPFPVTDNLEFMRRDNLKFPIVFAHNGTFGNVDADKKYSDTMMFGAKFLAGLSRKELMENLTIRNLLSEAVGHSRLATMDWEGNVVMYGNFEKHENGCHYSNKDWEIKPYTPPVNKVWDNAYWNRKGYGGLNPTSFVTVCEECGHFVRSYWNDKELKYLCPACAAESYKNKKANKGKKGKKQFNSNLLCDCCGEYGALFSSEIQGNLCSACTANDKWLRDNVDEIKVSLLTRGV